MSLAIFHPHFVIRIFPSSFYHPHFSIRILSSAIFLPHFIFRIFFYPPSAIRHPPPSGPHFTETQRKTIQSPHCESQLVPGWTDCFRVPFKESRFPLFGINTQPANEALDPKHLGRQGLNSFTEHKRPISSEDL